MRKPMLVVLSAAIVMVACADSQRSISDPFTPPQFDVLPPETEPCRSGDFLVVGWTGAPDKNGNGQVCLKTVNGVVRVGGERYYDDILPRPIKIKL